MEKAMTMKIVKRNGKIIVRRADGSTTNMSTQGNAVFSAFEKIKTEVDNELIRQFDKWGDQVPIPIERKIITDEEIGEVDKAFVEAYFFEKENDLQYAREIKWQHVQEEIIQTIACYVHLYYAIETTQLSNKRRS